MTAVSISNSGLIELAKKFQDFYYIALDSSATDYTVTQTGPLQEITSNGGQRGAGTAVHNANTGVVTLSKQFVFTGPVTVKAICPMNSSIAGQGVMLTRYLPDVGHLPDQFQDGGSLLVTLSCSLSRPA
jgi:hypothetical protein